MRLLKHGLVELPGRWLVAMVGASPLFPFTPMAATQSENDPDNVVDRLS